MIVTKDLKTGQTTKKQWPKKEREKFELAIKKDAEAKTYIENRINSYPDIGDQLDAIWKTLNQMRLNGQELPQEGDDMLNTILAIKKKYPKPAIKNKKVTKK